MTEITNDTAPEAEKQRVICPECGTAQEVVMSRREAVDFCAGCDFPLFWTPGVIVLGDSFNSDALRRLPGQGGRATVASRACPSCGEQNPLDAENCWRCGSPMVLPDIAPEPEPVFQVVNLPEPIPEPLPEPEFELAWWWWVIGGATVLALILLILVLTVF